MVSRTAWVRCGQQWSWCKIKEDSWRCLSHSDAQRKLTGTWLLISWAFIGRPLKDSLRVEWHVRCSPPSPPTPISLHAVGSFRVALRLTLSRAPWAQVLSQLSCACWLLCSLAVHTDPALAAYAWRPVICPRLGEPACQLIQPRGGALETFFSQMGETVTFLVIPGCCDGGEVGYGAVARMVGKEKRAKWMRDIRLV